MSQVCAPASLGLWMWGKTPALVVAERCRERAWCKGEVSFFKRGGCCFLVCKLCMSAEGRAQRGDPWRTTRCHADGLPSPARGMPGAGRCGGGSRCEGAKPGGDPSSSGPVCSLSCCGSAGGTWPLTDVGTGQWRRAAAERPSVSRCGLKGSGGVRPSSGTASLFVCGPGELECWVAKRVHVARRSRGSSLLGWRAKKQMCS